MSAFPDAQLCAGCWRKLEDGDRYIVDTAAGFLAQEDDPVVDGLIAEILGASDGRVRLCEDCTELGGPYILETFHAEREAQP